MANKCKEYVSENSRLQRAIVTREGSPTEPITSRATIICDGCPQRLRGQGLGVYGPVEDNLPSLAK
jgi:hypothetical protein